eukprot:3156571-Pleurochrysis_carterae.AAC.4
MNGLGAISAVHITKYRITRVCLAYRIGSGARSIVQTTEHRAVMRSCCAGYDGLYGSNPDEIMSFEGFLKQLAVATEAYSPQ